MIARAMRRLIKRLPCNTVMMTATMTAPPPTTQKSILQEYRYWECRAKLSFKRGTGQHEEDNEEATPARVAAQLAGLM